MRDSAIPNPTISFFDIQNGVYEPTVRKPMDIQTSSNKTPLSSYENGFKRING